MQDEIKYDDKKCLRFNNSLDEEGAVKIAGFTAMPSRILFEMDLEAYKQELLDFREQEFEELKNSIYNYYPSCIAYNFRLSEKGEGASDPVRRLLHLKDTWESIVFVLYAIVWGEIRHKAIDIKACRAFKQFDTLNNAIYESFNSKRLLSDAIKVKIQNIKAVVAFAKSNSLNLRCEIITDELFDKLLELQDIRNDISHHAAPTKEQAEEELKLVIPLFQEMLEETIFLEDIKILRFENYSTKCKCEIFNGHALNKEYEEFTFLANQSFVIGLGQENIFMEWGSDIFCLSPFLHFDKDNTGHESYLAFFKGKKESKYWFEPVKIRTEKSFDHLTGRFETEKDALLISDGGKEGDRKLGHDIVKNGIYNYWVNKYGKEEADRRKSIKIEKLKKIGKEGNKLTKNGRYNIWVEKYGKEEANKRYEEWRLKISQYQQYKLDNGWKHTEDAKEKISNARLGKKMSEETKNKMRKPKPKGFSEKLSKIKKGVSTGPSKKRKEVEQFDLDGKIIGTWESIIKVEKELNIYNINAVCKGKQKTAGGYKWKYKIKENE